MKKLILISAICTLVGCNEPTLENGCHGDTTYQEEAQCLRSMTIIMKQVNDSLKFELKLMQQKFNYECAERK